MITTFDYFQDRGWCWIVEALEWDTLPGQASMHSPLGGDRHGGGVVYLLSLIAIKLVYKIRDISVALVGVCFWSFSFLDGIVPSTKLVW